MPYSARSRDDPSRRGYGGDLDLAFDVSAGHGCAVWSHLVANSLIRATLSGIAEYLPVEAYETLVRVGRGREALQRARIVSEVPQKVRALAGIEAAARDLSESDLVEESQRELYSLPIQDGTSQTSDDDLLPDLVDRFGARRALQMSLRQRLNLDEDRSEEVQHYLEVVSAAFTIGRLEEARDLLSECLDFIGGTWEHHRQDFLVRAARLSLSIGNMEDLARIIVLACEIEHEHSRIYTLAEIALICSDVPDESLKKQSLEIAVGQVASVNPASLSQSELSKIALAMSKSGDDRATGFLERAIQLAERPTQPAWHWQEKEAWVNVAENLVLVGLCDGALDLIRRIGPREMSEGRVVVELALQDRWEDAWQLAQDAHPIVKERALLNTAHTLAKKEKLDDKRYLAVVTCIEEGLKGKNTDAQIAILGQLIELALLVQDGSRGHQYLMQMVEALNEIDGSKMADLIANVAHYAVKLSAIDEVHKLQDRAEALEEDPQYGSRSNAIGVIAIGLAKLEKIEESWLLARSITEPGKRLEAYVNICESELQQERQVDEHFGVALAFARSIDNVGWVPTFWGRLAVLARQLGHRDEERECVGNAIAGTCTIEASYAIGFNVHNSANVACALHELGMPDQAENLLRFGLAHFKPDFLGIGSLRRLVQSVTSVGIKSLWADITRAVQMIERPSEKAEALLGIAYVMGRSGDIGQAVEILPSVLAAIEEADQDRQLILEFGATLSEFLEPEDPILNNLIVEAFRCARSQDRPAVLTWIAGLLPTFAKAGSALPLETWTQIEQCEKMLGSQ
jgi:tetratricopeptide (TPR) repeat protein